eukprot:6200564-Pleurochrysis_carterae.AAC.4
MSACLHHPASLPCRLSVALLHVEPLALVWLWLFARATSKSQCCAAFRRLYAHLTLIVCHCTVHKLMRENDYAPPNFLLCPFLLVLHESCWIASSFAVAKHPTASLRWRSPSVMRDARGRRRLRVRARDECAADPCVSASRARVCDGAVSTGLALDEARALFFGLLSALQAQTQFKHSTVGISHFT